MFTVEMLPAQRGDCLWLTYGEEPKLRHVLIDAGPSETRDTLVPQLEDRIRALPGRRRTNLVELLVISHIDADHIQGVVSLLSGPGRVPLFRDVWFNGFDHLKPPEMLGAPDGEQLTGILQQHPDRWNKAFEGAACVVPDEGDLRVVELADGLRLTLLSPTPTSLEKLAPKWEEECEKAGLIPGKGAAVPPELERDDMLGFNVDAALERKYQRDRALPNGSSIVFVAEYKGRTLLCGADAHSEILEASLDRLGPGPHSFTAVKLSHHGSKGNTSRKFAERVRSRKWLVSTNGAKFHHPHVETLARVVKTQDRPVFYLNYVTEDVADLISGAGDSYSVKLPRKTRGGFREGITVTLG